MKLQEKLNKLLLVALLSLASANIFAETKWEVATLFFGQREDNQFQAGIQENIKELNSIPASSFLTLSIYKEGSTTPSPRNKLLAFLKNSFKDPKSKKMLVLYGHGLGPLGLRDLSTSEIKATLSQLRIKLDIIWFDACFLANIEFLYELQNASAYTIASEEAEFTSGLPFESLTELPNYDTSREAATFLAKEFINSYSYLKNGQQRDAVSTSSATISVIENSELDKFAGSLRNVSQMIRKLPAKDLEALSNKLSRKFSMDKKDLIDLGHLLIELRALVKDPIADKELTHLIRLLNIESVKKLQTNPRIRIVAPEARALMVFGFNGWENGHRDEYQDIPLFQQILNTNIFIVGMRDQEWPAKKFENKSLLITPFAPGVNSFNYYFLDENGKKLLTKDLSIFRTNDVIETTLSQKTAGSFLVYTAYTQRLGVKAERYTGINITLFNTPPSIDYFELTFNQATDWLRL